jgi:alkylation response protein AidB-like acyl-CoA dehydrogenase
MNVQTGVLRTGEPPATGGAIPHLAGWSTTPEQQEVYEATRRFALSLASDAIGRDRERRFSREDWDSCGAFGLQGLPAPQDIGGGGADVVTTMLALEAFGYGCRDAGLVFSVNAHLWTSVIPLWHHGTPGQQARWLADLCSGRAIGCHAITEPDAGSDPFGMRARATRVDGGYVLNGRKTFITNAPVADLIIVFARLNEGVGPFGISAFLIEAGTPGCSTGPETDKMGLRTSPMSDVVLDNCFVPDEALLGRSGRGGDVFQMSMRWERACIMASQVGVMQRTLEECVRYAKERHQFGKPIAKFGAISDKLASMKTAVDAARGLVLRVGRMMDEGLDVSVEAAEAKVFISEANVRCQLDAVQIHGGYGYMTEQGLERNVRDAIGGTIYSGTSEIQRTIIARGLGL